MIAGLQSPYWDCTVQRIRHTSEPTASHHSICKRRRHAAPDPSRDTLLLLQASIVCKCHHSRCDFRLASMGCKEPQHFCSLQSSTRREAQESTTSFYNGSQWSGHRSSNLQLCYASIQLLPRTNAQIAIRPCQLPSQTASFRVASFNNRANMEHSTTPKRQSSCSTKSGIVIYTSISRNKGRYHF